VGGAGGVVAIRGHKNSVRNRGLVVAAVAVSITYSDCFTRASVPIGSERASIFFVLTRFLHANRDPLRLKTL
jgi:hypothetical protein